MNEENMVTLFHGTTRECALEILGQQFFHKSCNKDDWLGTGIYFYENINNAIIYNIRKYYKNMKSYPEYNDLQEVRKIIVAKIECDDENILDLNEIENLQKFLGLWKMYYDKVKDNEEYNGTNYKDGYMIDWLFKHTNYFNECKIIKNIFSLDLKFKRKISKIFYKKTRLGYTLNQVFWCVIDEKCIKSIHIYNEDYEKEFVIIRNFTNNILME